MILVLKKEDRESLGIKQGKCLKLEDKKVLKQIQDVWLFKYTGGDISTTESNIYIYKDKILKFKSGIILEKDLVWLQSPYYGWLEPVDKNNILESYTDFKKVCIPIVILK